MPTEALENLMLDAIETELSRIGEAPASDWLTTTPPGLRTGVPGDKLPGPNQMTLYLQHVGSAVGEDNVGTAQHQLVATFAVYCCSSHAADGQRRVLNLIEDVRAALLQAEPAFYDAFKYGLAIGQVQAISDDARIRAGASITALEVKITADRTEPVHYNMINHPFEFPFPTASDRILIPSPTIRLDLTNQQRQVVFSRPTGTSGIVRNISFVTSASNGVTPTVAGSRIDIHYDGSATPTISIPLLCLIGMEHPRSSLVDLLVSTPAFEVSAGVYKSNFPGIPLGPAGNFRLPIPFTNGIEIAVVAPANSDIQQIFFNIAYQDRLPGCWNRNLRLFAERSNETVPVGSNMTCTFKITDPTHIVAQGAQQFPANIAGRSIVDDTLSTHDMLVLERTDGQHCVVFSKDTQGALLNVNSQGGGAGHFAHHTFLNRPAGESGWLAMIVAGLSDTIGDHAILLEGNPRIWLDGNLGEPDLQWTSVEDFANGAYYFEQRNIGEEGGVTAKDDTNYEVAAYKVFHKWPIPYANGIRASVPQYSMVGPAIYNWTTFYYKRM